MDQKARPATDAEVWAHFKAAGYLARVNEASRRGGSGAGAACLAALSKKARRELDGLPEPSWDEPDE